MSADAYHAVAPSVPEHDHAAFWARGLALKPLMIVETLSVVGAADFLVALEELRRDGGLNVGTIDDGLAFRRRAGNMVNAELLDLGLDPLGVAILAKHATTTLLLPRLTSSG